MASGMRRQFAVWIASEHAGWAVATVVMIIVSPFESVRLAPTFAFLFLFFFFPLTYVHTKGFS